MHSDRELPSGKDLEEEFNKYLFYKPEEFIETAYATFYKRNPDPAGREFYTNLLIRGEDPFAVLGRILKSPESKTKAPGWMARLFYLQKLTELPLLGNLFFPLYRLRNFLATPWRNRRLVLSLHRNLDESNFARRSAENLLFETISFLQKNPENRDANSFQDKKDSDAGMDALYHSLEEAFRGSREEIRNRVSVYFPYAMRRDHKKSIIDLGCGRGEWLALLKENGIPATGIEKNRFMLRECEAKGLSVIDSDVLDYLRSAESESAEMITAFHLAEHLPFASLVTLIRESFRVLQPGGILILETPNPENILVGSHLFYIDPTHKNPIPPLFLSWLVSQSGFKTEIKRLHPPADATKEDHPAFQAGMDYAIIAEVPGNSH